MTRLALSTLAVLACALLPSAGLAQTRTLFIDFKGGRFTHDTSHFWDQDARKQSFGLCGTCAEAGFGDFPPLTQPCRLGKSDCRRGTCTGKTYGIDTVNGVPVPYGRCSEPDPAYNAAVLATVRQLLSPFNVLVVDKQPAQGDYDRVLFNANITCKCGGPGGSAIMGCGLSRRNELLYAQQAILWEWEPWQLASFIAHEFGHTMGLVHHGSAYKGCDPMGVLCQPARFQDACVVHDGNNACREIHNKFCPPGQQNTYRLMLDVLGRNPVSTAVRAAPTDAAFGQSRDAVRVGAPGQGWTLGRGRRLWTLLGEYER